MTTLFDAFETDKDLEQKGIWIEVAPDIRFHCTRIGPMNKTYKRALSKKMKPHQRQYQQGTLDEELGDNLIQDVFIESILLGWEGVTDRKGEPPRRATSCSKRHKTRETPEGVLDLVNQVQRT